ncbi:hypothetical protein FRC12_015320 [Ceratobasidium sp. 428]|nr:hypothetical protein FRC12_015320 [Ceratobasidium sp. 428]
MTTTKSRQNKPQQIQNPSPSSTKQLADLSDLHTQTASNVGRRSTYFYNTILRSGTLNRLRNAGQRQLCFSRPPRSKNTTVTRTPSASTVNLTSAESHFTCTITQTRLFRLR